MQKTLRLTLAAALAAASFAALAAPQSLKNPKFAAKSCQSLEAQNTPRCKRTEDYCARKKGDPKCQRFNSLREKYPLEEAPKTASEPEPMDLIGPQ